MNIISLVYRKKDTAAAATACIIMALVLHKINPTHAHYGPEISEQPNTAAVADSSGNNEPEVGRIFGRLLTKISTVNRFYLTHDNLYESVLTNPDGRTALEIAGVITT